MKINGKSIKRYKEMFKDFIDNQMIEWPELFLKTTYEKSEASVLNHIFFVNGNGFEWKLGYPLLPSGRKNLIRYNKVDMEWFFKNRKKIWYLDFNDETFKFIKKFKFIPMKNYSNRNVWYVMDKSIVDDYNAKVDEELAKSSDKNHFDDFLYGIRKFKKVTHIFAIDKISFYPLCQYSKVNEILKQDKIVPETVEYALKTLDYAENFYMKKKTKEAKTELQQIMKLKVELCRLKERK